MRNTVAVLFAVLILTPAALAQPLPLRGEMAVSAPEIAPVLETSNDARVATNGETYVVTWTDLRAGEPRAYAARFLQDGTRLDPLGIDLHGDFSGSVVWSGATYVLIYGEATKIYSRTLGGDGLLGAPVVLHDQGSDAKIDIAAASNGTTILVTGDPLPALILDAQGNRLRTVALPWESSYRGIAVAAAGSRYLIVAGADQLRTQSVAGDGTLGASHVVTPLPVTAAVGVASDGARFFAVWSRDNVEGQFFDANGNPEGGVRALTNAIAASIPAVAWRGGEYFVTFSETQSQTIHSLRVSSDGIAMALPAQTTARSIEPAALVAIGANGVAVWRPRRGGLEAALFDADSLTGADPFRLVVPIAQAAQRQFDVRLARFAGGETILGWIEVTPHGNELRLSRGAGTTPVAPTRWPAARLIDLVVDGDVVWAVTSQSTSIYAQRISRTLQPVDADPILVASDAYSDPAYGAAAAGTAPFLQMRSLAIVYPVADENESDAESDMAVALVRVGSTTEITKIALPSGPFADHTPAIVWDGLSYMIVWARSKASATAHVGEPPPPDQVVSVSLMPLGGTPSSVRVMHDGTQPIRTILGAAAEDRSAFIWQTEGDLAPSMQIVSQQDGEAEQVSALEEYPDGVVGAFEIHHDGYVLVIVESGEGTSFATQTIRVVTTSALLQIRGITNAGSFATHNEWRVPDVDILGGAAPILAYARIAPHAQFGSVSRIHAQQAIGPRRRAVR